MSTFRTELLTKVSGLCNTIFLFRLEQVREQQLVSDKAKEDLTLLVLFYEQLCHLDPFPDADSVDVGPLEQLKTALATADNDNGASEAALFDWVRTVTNSPDPVPADEKTAAANAPSPINQRMLDATARLRSVIDTSRRRLFGQYDRDKYKAARNAFTLTREAYDHRLNNNGITATVQDAAQAEGPLYRNIDTATGATFPDSIQAAADFMEARIFTIS